MRILVVEDHPDNLEVMICLLEAAGHKPLVANNGAEGLESIRQLAPDLVLCDLQLPEMNGFELCRQVKGDPKLRHIPLIAVTALAMVGDRERILEAGFDGYIAKPVNPRNFMPEVESFLAGVCQKEPLHG